MKNKHFFAFVFLLYSITFFAQTYITDVTIVDVENQRLVPNQTVVITDDIITDIQNSSELNIPENAERIDGNGKYLSPGLVDAHIHFFQSGGLYTRPDGINFQKYRPYEEEIALAKADMEDKLIRYLQNGITTVIDVGANQYFLDKRKDFVYKKYAPRILMSGPLLTTYKPEVYEGLGDWDPFTLTKTIEEGIQGVRDQLQHDPDFIKIWYIAGADGLTVANSALKNLPIIKAIINEAHQNGVKVAVHATQRITAQLAVQNGADYLVHSIDDEIIQDDLVQLMKKNNTILCPSLIVSDGYSKTFGQRHNMSTHDLQKSNPHQLGTLLDVKHLADTLFTKRL